MRGKCNICGRIGDWPVFPCEVWYPNQNVPQQEQELLCAGCYEQTGAPFPHEVPEDELRKWHEEVISTFREHLRATSPKPKVYAANGRLFKDDVGYRHCVLCWADLGEQAQRQFIWRECDKVVRPAQVCVECAAICGAVSA
jgi:hypothetical protein